MFLFHLRRQVPFNASIAKIVQYEIALRRSEERVTGVNYEIY